jgi:hypothetical protein
MLKCFATMITTVSANGVIGKILGGIVIFLSVTVSLPLIMLTIRTQGWTWGFGMAGIPVLLPLSGYLIFGIVPFLRNDDRRITLFLLGHIVVLAFGLGSVLLFHLYPTYLIFPPLILSVLSILDRRRWKFYIVVCMIFCIVLNVLFLKWEFDFGRTLPLMRLFQTEGEIPEF